MSDVPPFTDEERRLVSTYGLCWCGAIRDGFREERDGRWIVGVRCTAGHE